MKNRLKLLPYPDTEGVWYYNAPDQHNPGHYFAEQRVAVQRVKADVPDLLVCEQMQMGCVPAYRSWDGLWRKAHRRNFVKTFISQFQPKVVSGEKTCTIRALPAAKHMPTVLDTITPRAWSVLPYRSPQHSLTGAMPLREVLRVVMAKDAWRLRAFLFYDDAEVCGEELTPEQIRMLARLDGFDCFAHFEIHFQLDQQQAAFSGVLLRWEFPGRGFVPLKEILGGAK